LIKSFQKKIKDVFGEVTPNIQIRDGEGYRRKNFCLQYPSIISLFILSVFDYKVKDGMDIPDFIFDMPNKHKVSFLRDLFDDEGTVSIKDETITIGVKPLKPITKIRRLLIALKINPSDIFIHGGIKNISLRRKRDIQLFNRVIGFKHPLKSYKLNKIIEQGWKFDRYPDGEVQNKIVHFLQRVEEASTGEIVKLLERHPVTVREHLNKLMIESLIRSRKTPGQNVWSIK